MERVENKGTYTADEKTYKSRMKKQLKGLAKLINNANHSIFSHTYTGEQEQAAKVAYELGLIDPNEFKGVKTTDCLPYLEKGFEHEPVIFGFDNIDGETGEIQIKAIVIMDLEETDVGFTRDQIGALIELIVHMREHADILVDEEEED